MKVKKNSLKTPTGILLFAALLLIAVHAVNGRIMSKGTEYGYYSAASAHQGFYRLKRNSADVLFLGSSHCYCGISPQTLYNDYRITSWNLGSSQQSVWLSYYWLKEALKYQKPKAVVLEVFYVMTSEGKGGGEPSIHWTLDGMKWSVNKLNAIRSCRDERPEISPTAFLFPNVRYHERIFDLSENDYPGNGGEYGGLMKGYVPLSESYGTDAEVFSPLDLSVTDKEDWYPKGREYLGKIEDLCRKENIPLILIKTPSTHWSVQEHNSIAEFAAACQIPFYDFNEADLYTELGYDLSVDNHDYGHANTLGSVKITDWIGKLLTDVYHLESHEDGQWAQSAGDVEQIMANCAMKRIGSGSNAAEYLSALAKGSCTLLLSGDQTDVYPFPEDIVHGLEEIGVDPAWYWDGRSFTAVIRIGAEGNRKPDRQSGDPSMCGTLADGRFSFQLEGRGSGDSESGSILINGKSQTDKKAHGIKLAVYDEKFRILVDSVCLCKDGTILRQD